MRGSHRRVLLLAAPDRRAVKADADVVDVLRELEDPFKALGPHPGHSGLLEHERALLPAADLEEARLDTRTGALSRPLQVSEVHPSEALREAAPALDLRDVDDLALCHRSVAAVVLRWERGVVSAGAWHGARLPRPRLPGADLR